MCISSFYLICAILVLSLVLVSGQSPCPDVFEYKGDSSGVYGVITVRPSGPVSTLQTRVNFTITTRLTDKYVGRIRPQGTSQKLLQEYNSGIPLLYRVDFPVTSPLPRVTSITVNDNVLCSGPGDILGPNQSVTTISLSHTLLTGVPARAVQHNPQPPPERPPPKPENEFNFLNRYFSDGDTQIFAFKKDENKPGIWNMITYPNSRLEFEKPVTRPPPAEPPQQPALAKPRFQQPAVTSYNECGLFGNKHQPLIFNGHNYNRGDWPWLVAIYKQEDLKLSYICSGTLVSDRHVVTAAHCMGQRNAISSKKDIVVKVGAYNLQDWGDDIPVTRTLASATIHEKYNAPVLGDDILVLTFKRKVEFNRNIRPACLWSGNNDLSRIVGAAGVVAGWGKSELGQAGSGVPRAISVPVVSTTECRGSHVDFHSLTTSNTLCAGDKNGAGPCFGDSGGGLYLLEEDRWRLRGVVSLSLRPKNGDSTTCNLNDYVVFTDSAKYISWIKNVMYNT